MEKVYGGRVTELGTCPSISVFPDAVCIRILLADWIDRRLPRQSNDNSVAVGDREDESVQDRSQEATCAVELKILDEWC